MKLLTSFFSLIGIFFLSACTTVKIQTLAFCRPCFKNTDKQVFISPVQHKNYEFQRNATDFLNLEFKKHHPTMVNSDDFRNILYKKLILDIPTLMDSIFLKRLSKKEINGLIWESGVVSIENEKAPFYLGPSTLERYEQQSADNRKNPQIKFFFNLYDIQNQKLVLQSRVTVKQRTIIVKQTNNYDVEINKGINSTHPLKQYKRAVQKLIKTIDKN